MPRIEFGGGFYIYHFTNGFVVTYDVDNGSICIFRKGVDLAEQKVGSVTNSRERRKMAIQFFKDNCHKFRINPNTVKFDYEEIWFFAEDPYGIYACIITSVTQLKSGGIKVHVGKGADAMGVFPDVNITSSREVRKIALDCCKKYLKIK